MERSRVELLKKIKQAGKAPAAAASPSGGSSAEEKKEEPLFGTEL